MNKRLLFIPLLFFFACSQAQFDTSFIKKNIRQYSDSLVAAFKSGDWDQFTRYSYPPMVASIGGTKEFSEYIRNMFSGIPASAWKKYETGNILQVIKTEGDYQALLELNTIIEWDGIRTTATYHLVGESWDGGRFWTFFDSQGDRTAAKMIKPDLDDKLVIPARVEKREPIK